MKKNAWELGVSLRFIDTEQSLESLRLLKGTAVRALEIWEPDFRKDDAFVDSALAILADAGIEPRTVHADFGRSVDLSAPSETIREQGIASVRRALDLARRLGSRRVIVHASLEPIAPSERADHLARAKQSARRLANLAEDAGVPVAMELLPRTCIGNTVEELRELVDEIDPALVGFCLDTNHIMDRASELPDIARRLAPRLIALHCSDYDGVDEKHWPPGRGVIDWPAFLQALVEIQYDGPLHYEAYLGGDSPAERIAFLESNFHELTSNQKSQVGN